MSAIAICTGAFDPLHPGHLQYFQAARGMADQLIVGVNSDQWLVRKRGQNFLEYEQRKKIISSIRWVDCVMGFDDADDSACDLIRRVREAHPDAHLLFCNDGDRTATNIPEMHVYDEHLSFHFSVGGTSKAASSTGILSEWGTPWQQYPWGQSRTVAEEDGFKVKLIHVQPGESLARQRHRYRHETWQFLDTGGRARVELADEARELNITAVGETIDILPLMWHEYHNTTDRVVRVLETQIGVHCRPDDVDLPEVDK